MPSEFAGQPRWLDELKRQKARELRSFLLYVGPVVLKGLLRPEKYTHFFSLLASTRIILDEDSNIPSVYSGYVNDVSITLKRIAWNIMVAPLHLIILVIFWICVTILRVFDNSNHFQRPLDDISYFLFENYNQILKKYVRNAHSP